jgi:ribosome-associated protein
LTTKKRGGGSTPEGPRPRIKSSHGKVTAPRRSHASRPSPLPAAAAKTRVRSPDGERERADVRERARGPKKARSPEGPRPDTKPDANGAWSAASGSARETATAIAVAALDKKAVGLQILDVAGRVDYADFLVIMTGRSDRHAQALSQGIEEAMRSRGLRPVAVEGLSHGAWVLMDFGDVVVHVFMHESRELYDIDGLWLDARRLPVPGASDPE